jgi:RNA polymerase sigma-70 factor (ECF subfamily)
MLTSSDEELVRRCQEELPDNTSSYERLVQRYSPQVFNRVYRLVGDREEAEDITQEVFIKVYYNLKKFEQPAAFSGWLYRIATNTALNSLQKRKRRPAKAASSPPSPQKAELMEDSDWQHSGEMGNTALTNPEQLYLQAELRNCISEVFSTLQREQATVLIMRDIDNLSYDEVASTIGVGLSTIKMRIYRARVAFQELFKKLCSAWASHLQAQPVASKDKDKLELEQKRKTVPNPTGGEA